MPAALRFFRQDPNGLGRGRGVYYRRATGYNGKSYKSDGGYFSKYGIGPNSRDAKIKAKGWKQDKIGIPAKSKTKHAGDGRRPW